MAKYVKNPIPIDAVEYRSGLEDGFDDFEIAVGAGLDTKNYISPVSTGRVPYIKTLEGKHYISQGDFIITGVSGERYPCKREIFLKTYTMIKH